MKKIINTKQIPIFLIICFVVVVGIYLFKINNRPSFRVYKRHISLETYAYDRRRNLLSFYTHPSTCVLLNLDDYSVVDEEDCLNYPQKYEQFLAKHSFATIKNKLSKFSLKYKASDIYCADSENDEITKNNYKFNFRREVKQLFGLNGTEVKYFVDIYQGEELVKSFFAGDFHVCAIFSPIGNNKVILLDSKGISETSF